MLPRKVKRNKKSYHFLFDVEYVFRHSRLIEYKNFAAKNLHSKENAEKVWWVVCMLERFLFHLQKFLCRNKSTVFKKSTNIFKQTAFIKNPL